MVAEEYLGIGQGPGGCICGAQAGSEESVGYSSAATIPQENFGEDYRYQYGRAESVVIGIFISGQFCGGSQVMNSRGDARGIPLEGEG